MGLNRELDGYLVVALEQAVSAPYCSLLLADAGARVIKLERPEGDFCRHYDSGADGQSVWFAWLNRGKQSVTVDYTRPEDAALIRRLIGNADVFLHNLSPGALDRHGFSQNAVRALNPSIINIGITGFGSAGQDKKAYDFLVQAESGICAVTGTLEHPARVGISICDIGTGLTAFSAVLRGLLQRSKTAKGLDLSVSMFDVMADWMNMPLLAHRYLPHAPARMGLQHAMLAPYGAYACKGGDHILIGIQNDREWRTFCDEVLKEPWMGRDERFMGNAQRVANRAALDQQIRAVFECADKGDLASALTTARIAWANLNGVEDLSRHAFLRQTETRFGDAVVEMADLPVISEGANLGDVPALGQHDRLVREEFSE